MLHGFVVKLLTLCRSDDGHEVWPKLLT